MLVSVLAALHHRQVRIGNRIGVIIEMLFHELVVSVSCGIGQQGEQEIRNLDLSFSAADGIVCLTEVHALLLERYFSLRKRGGLRDRKAAEREEQPGSYDSVTFSHLRLPGSNYSPGHAVVRVSIRRQETFRSASPCWRQSGPGYRRLQSCLLRFR